MNHAAKRDKAARKIARFGSEAVFVFEGNRVYDPIAGKMSAERVEERVMAVMGNPDERAIASGAARVGDAVLLAAGMKNAPLVDGLVRYAGKDWRIVSFNPVAPDGNVIIYKIFIRRS